jgi:hypothetical protein
MNDTMICAPMCPLCKRKLPMSGDLDKTFVHPPKTRRVIDTEAVAVLSVALVLWLYYGFMALHTQMVGVLSGIALVAIFSFCLWAWRFAFSPEPKVYSKREKAVAAWWLSKPGTTPRPKGMELVFSEDFERVY